MKSNVIEGILNDIKRHTISNPITARELGARYNMSPETVREIISEIFRAERGLEIGSGTEGFFWARVGDELKGTLAHYRSRRIKAAKSETGVKRAYRRLQGVGR